MSSSELLQRLRLADAALASMEPSADLEARIRARAKGRGVPRLSSMLAGARRLHRPLILAFATAAALFAISGPRGEGTGAPPRVAGGPEEPAEHIVNDRIRTDGGRSEPTPGERGAGPRPVFHMPALEQGPRDVDPAVAPRSPAAPLPAPAPSALAPSLLDPSTMIPSKSSGDTDDRARGPSRLDASRPALSSMARAAGVASSGAPSTPKLAFVPRAGGDFTSHDVAPSTPSGGAASGAESDCKTPSALRQIALTRCEETGLVLSTFTFLEPCGDGRFGSMYSECADPEPDPKPMPAPSQCVQGTFGGGSICIELGGDLKDPTGGIQVKVTAACAELGLDVSGFSVDAVDCPVGSGKVAYTCCPTPAPSSGVDACFDSKVGSSDCEDLAALTAAATTLCAQSGDVLATLTPLAGCPDGQASIAMISCCPPTP